MVSQCQFRIASFQNKSPSRINEMNKNNHENNNDTDNCENNNQQTKDKEHVSAVLYFLSGVPLTRLVEFQMLIVGAQLWALSRTAWWTLPCSIPGAFSKINCWFCKRFNILLMATRNPVNSPVEVGSLSHYSQGFTCLRWCRISAINSISVFISCQVQEYECIGWFNYSFQKYMPSCQECQKEHNIWDPLRM